VSTTLASSVYLNDFPTINVTESDPFFQAFTNGTNITGNTLNLLAHVGNCSTGQFVVNTTIYGVQCAIPAGTIYFNGTGLILINDTFSIDAGYLNSQYYPLQSNPSGFYNSTNLPPDNDSAYVIRTGDLMSGDLNLSPGVAINFNDSNPIPRIYYNSTENELYLVSPGIEMQFSNTSGIIMNALGFNKRIGGTYQFGFQDGVNFTQVLLGNSNTTNAYLDVFGNTAEFDIQTLNGNAKYATAIGGLGAFSFTNGFSVLGNSSRRWKQLYVGDINFNGTINGSIGSGNITNPPWLLVSDQRYNDSALIFAVNNTSNIQSLGFNTTSQLTALFNNLYYSTSNPVNYLNVTGVVAAVGNASTKASPGNCLAGQVVMNTTTSGVQCVLMSTSTGNITGSGNASWFPLWRNGTDLNVSIMRQVDNTIVEVGGNLNITGNLTISGTVISTSIPGTVIDTSGGATSSSTVWSSSMLNYNLSANSTYVVECHLMTSTAATNTGFQVRINVSGTPSFARSVYTSMVSNSAMQTLEAVSTTTMDLLSTGGSTTTSIGFLDTYITTSTNPVTWNLFFKSEVGGSNVNLIAGSHCDVDKLGV
jgi:hypothetical protein